MLPVGAKVVGDHKSSNTQPMIHPMNIYMKLFNDLFTYFVVVVFQLFSVSKNLIRDSQRL